MQTAASRHVQCAPARTVNLVHEVDQTDRIVLGRLEDHGSSSVPKNHAGRAVGVINDRRHHIRPDHHDLLMCAGGDELSACLQSINKS